MQNICYIHRGENPKSDFIGFSVAPTDFIFDYKGKSTLSMLWSAFLAGFSLPKASVYIVEGGLGFWVTFFKKMLLPKTKIIVMAVDPIFNWRERSRLKNWFLKKTFSKIDYCLPISKLVAEDFRYYSQKIPYSIVHHFIDIEEFEKIEPEYSNKNLLFIINRPQETNETKGLDIVLQIFKLLHTQDSEWSLYIIGQDTRNLDNSYPNVFYKGEQKPSDYLKKCPILIIPARYEAFSLVAAEASVSGVFPIISKTAGAKEFLEKACPDSVIDFQKPEFFVKEILKYHPLPSEKKKEIANNLRKLGKESSKDRSIKEMKEAIRKINEELRINIQLAIK